MAELHGRRLRMALHGAYFVLLIVIGPVLHREPLSTTLWLLPLVLAAAVGNALVPPASSLAQALLPLDLLVIFCSATLRHGVHDPALLLLFPLLATLAGRLDRRRLLVVIGVAVAGVAGLATVAGSPVWGATLAAALAITGGVLWSGTRRGSLLHQRLHDRERDFDRLSLTFSRYFSPQVAQLLAAEGQSALATGRRDISVLFADLSGFTRFTEANTAEAVVGALGEYLDELCRVALHHDGTLDKFMGDEVMVVWNAPANQPDHARRALACARDMLLVMQILNQERAQRGDTVLGLSIGVNSGDVVVGHIGGQDRVQYTVIGDTVNVAKRLQSAATAGQIVAGLTTVVGAGETARATEELHLKGRAAPVLAVRLGEGTRKSAA